MSAVSAECAGDSVIFEQKALHYYLLKRNEKQMGFDLPIEAGRDAAGLFGCLVSFLLWLFFLSPCFFNFFFDLFGGAACSSCTSGESGTIAG
jgi:hypothetical protein